jgi:hypothetical protein
LNGYPGEDFSMIGIFMFSPGRRIRLYLPKTVTTAIEPCFTVTKSVNKAMKPIKRTGTSRISIAFEVYGVEDRNY